MHDGSFIEEIILEIEMKSGNEKMSVKAVNYNKNKSVIINTNEYKSIGY